MIDTTIQEILKRRNFQSFWCCFDYLILANYTELEAMMIGLEMFNGQIWDGVINANYENVHTNQLSYSNNVITVNTGTYTYHGLNVTTEPDDLWVEVFIMTKEANPVYMALYKSYIETRKYAELPLLEGHIKSIRLKLTTELTINLFKEGCKNIK